MNNGRVKETGKFRRALPFIGVAMLVLFFVAVHMALGIGVRLTKNRPKESDLVGIYRPNLKTRFLIRRGTKSPATNFFIKLYGSGKIEFVNVGRWLIGNGDTNNMPLDLAPTNAAWKLAKYEEHWDVDWSYDNVSGDGLRLVGEKPPYCIQAYNWQTGVPWYFMQEKP